MLRLPDGCRGGDDLRPHRAPVRVTDAEGFDGGFVQPDHGAERAGYEVQLVLDDEVRGRQRRVEALSASGLGRTTEPCRIEAGSASEQLAGLLSPGK